MNIQIYTKLQWDFFMFPPHIFVELHLATTELKGKEMSRMQISNHLHLAITSIHQKMESLTERTETANRILTKWN
jgi:hypothetical protein